MKVTRGEVIFVSIFLITEVTGRQPPHIDTSALLGHLNLGSSKQNPLIVIVNAETHTEPTKYYANDEPSAEDDRPLYGSYAFEKEAKEQAKYLLHSYLMRTSPEDEDASTEDTKAALLNVLRARCQAVVKCTEKCDRSESSYCPKSCKAVFDELNLCDTPKPKKDPCKKESPCGRGKTMPPKWLL